jgi:hypothetical protein
MIGLVVTITGQLIRGITIGLAYIIRGGKDRPVYAEDLVTEGMFNHCRNEQAAHHSPGDSAIVVPLHQVSQKDE